MSIFAEQIAFKKQSGELAEQERQANKIINKQKAQDRLESGEENVIDKFKALNPLADYLVDEWGATIQGNKYCSPNSTTGNAAIVVMGDKAFSHHGSDSHIGKAQNDGVMFDQVDLFFELHNDGVVDMTLLNDEVSGKTDSERKREYAQAKSAETALDGFDFEAVPGSKVVDINPGLVSKKRGFTLVPASQLTSKPRPNDWLIKDIIESNNYGMIFGEPESGKSLLTLDMAFCISNGLPWNGHPTKQGNVAYVAGEGHTGLARRVKALELMYNTKTDNLFFSEMPASLTDEHSVKDVASTIKAVCADPVLIVVDTLHRNFGSGDENSAGDFGTATNHIDTHLRSTGAAVILVHHSGHGAKDRSRGSSSIKAALDVEYNVSKNQENIVSMVCTKSKDFNKPKPQNFEINEVDLGWKDEDGQPIKSINLEGYEGDVSRGKTKELSHRNKQILATLTEAVEAFGEEPNNTIRLKYTCYNHDKVVSTDNWRKIAYRIIDAETTNAKKSAFNRACAVLQKSKDIQLYDGYYWIGTKALMSDPDTANNSMWASSINHASYK